MLKKVEKCKKYYFVKNKYQSVKHVFTSIFQGLFKNIVFRSVALIIKSCGLFKILFYILRFLIALRPTLWIKKIYKKNSLNFYSGKTKNLRGSQTPPPSLFRVKSSWSSSLFHLLWVTLHTLFMIKSWREETINMFEIRMF